MCYFKNPECICEKTDDGIILFNESTEDTINLNQTAAYLYEHCELGDAESIIQSLVSVLKSAENIAIIKQDCEECIRQMINAKILLEVDNA